MTKLQSAANLNFTLRDSCQKHLLFADAKGTVAMQVEAERMVKTGHSVEWNHLVQSGNKEHIPHGDERFAAVHTWSLENQACEFEEYLQDQPMGTHLYVAAHWAIARHILRISETAGYASEHIQIHGYGPKYSRVYCIGCYSMNSIGETSYLTCGQCGREIEVSNVYSKRLDAVLGYLVLPNQAKKASS